MGRGRTLLASKGGLERHTSDNRRRERQLQEMLDTAPILGYQTVGKELRRIFNIPRKKPYVWASEEWSDETGPIRTVHPWVSQRPKFIGFNVQLGPEMSAGAGPNVSRKTLPGMASIQRRLEDISSFGTPRHELEMFPTKYNGDQILALRSKGCATPPRAQQVARVELGRQSTRAPSETAVKRPPISLPTTLYSPPEGSPMSYPIFADDRHAPQRLIEVPAPSMSSWPDIGGVYLVKPLVGSDGLSARSWEALEASLLIHPTHLISHTFRERVLNFAQRLESWQPRPTNGRPVSEDYSPPDSGPGDPHGLGDVFIFLWHRGPRA
ncbi:hypothetical protein DFH07DRAFT_1021266 [Mycena maculata]|uniref:Uncharacterized protein n=1 Tax=Mycena maculata TaxID=230809 RepID=A0AAD7JAM9_9AGAR|nr:hypothetical protein DFH07DRAFT_1021266 [Mycena maculata]